MEVRLGEPRASDIVQQEPAPRAVKNLAPAVTIACFSLFCLAMKHSRCRSFVSLIPKSLDASRYCSGIAACWPNSFIQ